MSGTSVDYWNVTLPSGEVIGRHLNSGGRRYYLKDHLGSTRAVVDGNGTVQETRDYYPFGLPMPGRITTEATPAKEDFTGHEKDAETGLHYAGARSYMSALGRWNGIDPLGGDYPGWSPYGYVLGNPVNLMDPNGMEPCPYDPSQECGIILPEVEVTAERPEQTIDAGTFGGTFFFNSSTRSGRSAFREHLRDNPEATQQVIVSNRFSTTAKQIAVEEDIYAAQRQFMGTALRISLESGANLAMVTSMVSGVGTVAGVGGLLLRRGALSSAGRQGLIRLVGTSSQVGLYASGAEAGSRIGSAFVGGSAEQAGYAALSAVATYGFTRPAVLGLRATGLAGPAFRDIQTGRFVTNNYGIGRFSIVNGIGATPGFLTLTIDDK